LITAQDTARSEEIRSDRQNAFVARTSKSAEGAVNIELSNETYDDFIEAVLQADTTWSALITDVSANITIAFNAADQSIQDSGATGTLFANYVIGQWIKIEGSANTENTGLFKIISKPTDKMIVQGGNLLVDEAAGASVSLTQLSSINNGVLQKFFSIQKTANDVTPFYGEIFQGMTADTAELSIEAGSIITGAFGFMGKVGAPLYGNAYSTLTAANNDVIMTATDNVIYVITSCQRFCVNTFDISINNNGDKEMCIGELSANRIRSGEIDVSGSLEIYLEGRENQRRFHEFEDVSFTIIFEDENGRTSGVEILRSKLTQANANAEAKNDSLFDSIEFEAFADDTEDITIRWFRDYTP